MNFALLNFVLNAVRDSCALVCIASSKILVLLQNCVACLLIQGIVNRSAFGFFPWDIACQCCVLANESAIHLFICFLVAFRHF